MKGITYMTGGQLAVALKQVGWDAGRFCDVTGTKPERMKHWLNDADKIPRWVPILMTTLTVQTALDMAGRAHKLLLSNQHEEMAQQRGYVARQVAR